MKKTNNFLNTNNIRNHLLETHKFISKIRFTIHLLIIFFIIISLQSCSSSEGSDIRTDDPEVAFSIAKRNYNKKDYLEAIDDFSLIKIRFSGTSVIDKAQYYLAMCYFKREEYILAAYEFEYLIKNYPTSEYVIKARYNLAMCYYNLSPDYELDQTYTKYAIIEFQNFLELYPTNKLAPKADAKIMELRNKLAYKDYISGKLYLKIDDNKAAIFYFDHVLDEYFDTKYADDALYGKIQALINRKKFEEAKKEIERFEKKFSNSSLLSKVLSLKRDIPS